MPTPRRSPTLSSRSPARRGGTPLKDPGDLISPQVRGMLAQFRLEDVMSHLLRRAHFRAEEIFAGEFAKESITPRQKATLVILYKEPGLSQNALADRLFMDRNTVAEMVKRMVSGGLVQRVPAKTDQRAYELFLTPESALLLDRVLPRDLEVEKRIAEPLPEEYRPIFMKCLRLLVETRKPETDDS